MALDIVQRVNASGIRAKLQIIGCEPPIDGDSREHVQLHGYLSPENSDDRTRMVNAFTQADFFLLPSRAECFGLVFAEAQSYGLPCIALDCHGIPGVVENRKTGLLFDAATSAERIVEMVIRLARDRTNYLKMAEAARMKFANELNWDSFGTRLHDFVMP
jgi:glycosyltransferase involved in cell wall biosynthesis